MFEPLYTSSYGKEAIVSDNFAIQNAFNRGVIDRTLSDPPTNPSSNGFYIPVATATGAWSGLENKLLWWSSAGSYWRTVFPTDGMKINSQADGNFLQYDGVLESWDLVTTGTTNQVFENVANISALNALTDMIAGDIAEVLNSDGSNNKGWFVYTGTSWKQITGT